MDVKAGADDDFNLEDALDSGGSDNSAGNDRHKEGPPKDFSWVEPFNPEDDKVRETVSMVEYIGTEKK
ncbi:unnamed protein product [Cylicocyclus nassatus]|uniref:Uncharacterized protein n=1 Tax=Cylicocyclus nassatus TaxID=53992 RepID=A0AA36H5N0_CYLNA|nr:unnamed protein product [Cylicocyclus nassatus]